MTVPSESIPSRINFSVNSPGSGQGTTGAVLTLKKNWQAPFRGGLIARMNAVGKQMVAEAREIAPRGQTGHLIESINARVVQSRSAGGAFGGAVLELRCDADYALAVEFGHHTRDGQGFVEARPFLRPVAMKKRKLG